jgi:hypothetical protein
MGFTGAVAGRGGAPMGASGSRVIDPAAAQEMEESAASSLIAPRKTRGLKVWRTTVGLVVIAV